jgi:hypothetical protein
LAFSLLAAPAFAGAQALTPQEQILLAGPLADPAAAREYAANPDPTLWRARLVEFCKRYRASPPPLNEKASSLKGAMTPAQWAMLMATIRALKKSDSWADQAKLKIFIGMIEDADEGLKNGDPADARKVEKTANPPLFEAMDAFLATPAAQAAVAKIAADKAATDKAAADKAAADKAAADKAAADKLAADKVAHEKALADAKRRNDLAAQERLAKEQKARDALEQARRAAEEKAADQGKTFDNSAPKKDDPAVVAPGETPVVVPESGSQPTKDVPTLAKPDASTSVGGSGGGGPPSPAAGDDMAELRQMKKETEDRGGWRKYAAGGLGAVLGGLLGFLLGGPIGAVIGAAAGGAGGFFLVKKFWG